MGQGQGELKGPGDRTSHLSGRTLGGGPGTRDVQTSRSDFESGTIKVGSRNFGVVDPRRQVIFWGLLGSESGPVLVCCGRVSLGQWTVIEVVTESRFEGSSGTRREAGFFCLLFRERYVASATESELFSDTRTDQCHRLGCAPVARRGNLGW